MKKIIVSFMIVLLVVVGGLSFYTVNASANIELNLTGATTIKQKDKTLTLILALGNFTEISDNCVLGYEAVLDYNESVFESVTVKGLNGWTSNYEKSTKILIGDISSAKANTQITELVFTLKEGVQPTTTDIQLKNIMLTNDENDFEYNKKVTVTIQGEETSATPDGEAGGESNNQDTTGDKTTTPAKNTDTTTANKKIPAAGYKNIIIVIVIGILVIGILSLIRYKSIKLK